jgi:hypothetical protein
VIAHGHAEVRAAIAALVDEGSRIELSGLGAMVSRRGADGSWRIVVDDPLVGPRRR